MKDSVKKFMYSVYDCVDDLFKVVKYLLEISELAKLQYTPAQIFNLGYLIVSH